jgi:hypothetical protein
MKEVYVVTAIGVGIDTKVIVCETLDIANRAVEELKDEYGLTDIETICLGCIKGYGGRVHCDVEIEIHNKTIRSNAEDTDDLIQKIENGYFESVFCYHIY